MLYYTIPYHVRLMENFTRCKKYNIMCIVRDETKELDSKNSITVFTQHASKKVAVRQMSVMFRKCITDRAEC